MRLYLLFGCPCPPQSPTVVCDSPTHSSLNREESQYMATIYGALKGPVELKADSPQKSFGQLSDFQKSTGHLQGSLVWC